MVNMTWELVKVPKLVRLMKSFLNINFLMITRDLLSTNPSIPNIYCYFHKISLSQYTRGIIIVPGHYRTTESVVFRYFDGETDITGSFTGDAKEERPGEWELSLSQGGT